MRTRVHHKKKKKKRERSKKSVRRKNQIDDKEIDLTQRMNGMSLTLPIVPSLSNSVPYTAHPSNPGLAALASSIQHRRV